MKVHRTIPIFAIICSLSLVQCGPSVDKADIFQLADLDKRRVPLDKEWRDAWRVPTVDLPAIDLGVIPEDGVLRLGVLPTGFSTANTSNATIFAGDTRVDSFTITREEYWQDFRLDLSSHGGQDLTCRIVLEDGQGDWLGPCEVISPGRQHQPNVLLFLIDTLRKDHLGAYGYHRNTSPNIDALARDGVVFLDPMAQTSWTRPSVASILTSTYPHIHGANDWPDVLREDLPKLGHSLQAVGYETQAFFINPQVLPVWGFGNEFTRCIDVDAELGLVGEDEDVVDEVLPMLRHAAGRPWFAYVHTLGPHEPYLPPEGYDTLFQPDQYEGDAETIRRQKLIDLYDGEIAFTDAQFGRIIDELKALELYDDTMIIVTSDHGEEFWEHGGELHGQTLYEEVINVPLIIKWPKQHWAGETRGALVETIDIAPTVLDVVGAPREPRFQGRSLVELLKEPELDNRMGFASLFYEAHSMRAVKRHVEKYIRDSVAGVELWFDLARDPTEQHPLPEPGDPDLMRYMDYVISHGRSGLHILITSGDNEEHTISGIISGAGIESYEFDYYESKRTDFLEEGVFQFDMVTTDDMDRHKRRDVWHTEHAEQDNAHIYLPAIPDEPLRIQLTVDGAPAPPDVVFVGKDGANTDLADATLSLHDLMAAPDAYDPAVLPRRFAIYVWYIPDVERLSIEDLDDEILEELKALGYLQ